MDSTKCTRCGICCLSGVCPEGQEDENGMCTYLIIEDDKTICKLVRDNLTNTISIGEGCVLKKCTEYYNYYLDKFSYYKHLEKISKL